MGLQWRHRTQQRKVGTHQTRVLPLQPLQALLQPCVMSITLAPLEPHVAAFLSIQGTALHGDAAPLSLLPAVRMAPAVALPITLSVMFMPELAYW